MIFVMSPKMLIDAQMTEKLYNFLIFIQPIAKAIQIDVSLADFKKKINLY